MFNSSPEKSDDNERRRQPRLLQVLKNETDAVVSPCAFVLFFDFVIYFATIKIMTNYIDAVSSSRDWKCARRMLKGDIFP